MTEIPYELELKPATVNRIVQTFSGSESMGKSIKWFRSIRETLMITARLFLLLTPEGVHVMNDCASGKRSISLEKPKRRSLQERLKQRLLKLCLVRVSLVLEPMV